MRRLAVFLVVLMAVGVGLRADTPAPTNRTFSGRALAPNGKPIEGVEVSAYIRESRKLNSRLKLAGTPARTDKDGNYRMTDLKPSVVYTIAVRARGYERQKWNAVGTRYLTFRLRPAKGSLSGHVVDRDGKPVSGVWVKVGLGVDSLYTCRTGGDGRFSFSDLIDNSLVAVCVGADTYKEGAQVGDKDVKIIVDPDRVKDFKPLFPDNDTPSSILGILKKLTDH